MNAMRKLLNDYARDTSGATAIEYGLIAALIGVGIIGSIRLLGGGTDGMWTKISNKVGDEM